MGIEIYLRNPRNALHRNTSLMMLGLSLIFIGEFFVKVLPLEQSPYAALYIVELGACITMTMSLYFCRSFSRVSGHPLLLDLLCLLPMVGAAVIFYHPDWMSVTVVETADWRLSQMSKGLAAVIFTAMGYTVVMDFLFLAFSYRKLRPTWSMINEHKRNRIIVLGSVIGGLWVLAAVILKLYMEVFSGFTLDLPLFCAVIWAFSIRYAMVKYDFLASTQHRFELLFSLSRNGKAIFNGEGSLVDANAAFKRLAGFTERNWKPIHITSLIKENERNDFHRQYTDSFNACRHMKRELEIQNVLGENFIVEIDTDYMEMDGQALCFLVTRDVTEKKHYEKQLAHMAYHDALTGLGNRTKFKANLEHALGEIEQSKGSLAVMLIDLDHFKWINDTFGHSAGDTLLQQVAEQLTGSLPDRATVARLGGDEFSILLPDIAGTEEALARADILIKSLQKPFKLSNKSYSVTASIGISIAPEDGEDYETLIRNADTAMYMAKQEGRNRYHLFAPNLKTMAEQHISLVNGISAALEQEEFTLHYQPQYQLRTNRLIGVEALLRWNSTELGKVSPTEFIPIAEDIRTIIPIGNWVLQSAIRQAKQWVDEGHTKLVISVNISTLQLREPNFVDKVQAILTEIGLPPQNLCLEITESTAIHDMETSLLACEKLVGLGVLLALDDFGVGYSSLSMLKRFPFHFLKIDRALLQDIEINKKDAAVFQTLVELSEHLEILVIAEGIETEEQLNLLRMLGCPIVQGFYCSLPLLADQISLLLQLNTGLQDTKKVIELHKAQ